MSLGNPAQLPRSLHLPAFSVDGQEPLAVSGTLEEPPQRVMRLDVLHSAFGALAAEVHPVATAQGSAVQAAAIPHEQTNGPAGYVRELGSISLPYGHGYTQDFNAVLAFGDPYPFPRPATSENDH